MRLSIDDARDIPSIRTDYAGAVPILHASSGIRRVVALAYMLTWAWSEHRIAAELTGEKAARHVTMLFDEVESHLHPRCSGRFSRRCGTSAPYFSMVPNYSSLPPRMHRWCSLPPNPGSIRNWTRGLDLDLDGDPLQAHLRRRSYTPRGSPGAWLTSDAFDLKTERGSMEAERAVLCARELLRKQADASLDEVMRVHTELRAVLPDVDRFWVGWNAFVEDRGGRL